MINKATNRLLKKLIFIFSLLCSLPCFPQGGETFNGRVLFIAYQGQVINPFTTYGNQLRYYIAPSAGSFEIKAGGRSYTRHAADLIEEASKEWEPVFGGQIKFKKVDSEKEADLIVTSLPYHDRRKSAYAQGLAKVVNPDGRTFKAELKLFINSIQDGFDNIRDSAKKYMGADVSDEEVLDFFMRVTTKHELGHIFGFTHPNFDRPNDSIDSPWTFVVLTSYATPYTPIMFPNIHDYMRSLHEHLGRDITIANITISEQEVAAAHILYEDYINGCFPSSTRYGINKSFLHGNYTCLGHYVFRDGFMISIISMLLN